MKNNFAGWFHDNALRGSVIGVLAILALFLLAQTINTASDFGRPGVPATDTITVRGEGQATVPPDVARITFTVQNSASTVSSAQQKTTAQANAAIDFVKQQGIADKDVRTLSYNIYPQYQACYGANCPGYNPNKIIGYQVSESVQITMRDLSKTGDMLAGLGKLNVQNLSGPDFTLEDTTAGYDAARADAIEKAKAQAATLASQLGVRLGKIVNYSEGSTYYPVAYGMGGGASDMKAPAPNVPTGQNTYTASVSITYEIR